MKEFPIMGSTSHGDRPPRKIPWDMIQPHEDQAWINHGQSLKRLAERGGLGYCEALAVLNDRPWRRMKTEDAVAELERLVREYNEGGEK